MNTKKNKYKKNHKKNNEFNISQMRCPYCGSPVEIRSSEGIYKSNEHPTKLCVCKKYPACDSYVRLQPNTNKPIGVMANQKLRSLRSKAHYFFNQLYESGCMTKGEAYQWLADITCLPSSEAHIGNFGEYNCNLIVNKCKDLLVRNKKKGGTIRC